MTRFSYGKGQERGDAALLIGACIGCITQAKRISDLRGGKDSDDNKEERYVLGLFITFAVSHTAEFS